jgi:CHAT domain-containing protein
MDRFLKRHIFITILIFSLLFIRETKAYNATFSPMVLDTTFVNHQIRIADSMFYERNFEEAKRAYSKAQQKLKKDNNLIEYYNIENKVIDCYIKLRDFNGAAEHSDKAVEVMMSLKMGNSLPCARARYYRAAMYRIAGDFQQASQLFLNIIVNASPAVLNDEGLFLGKVYIEFGKVLRQQLKIDSAIELYTQGQRYYLAKDSTSKQMSSIYNELAACYYESSRQDLAMGYLNKTLEFLERNGENLKSKMMTYGLMGMIHLDNGAFDRAIIYFNNQLDLALEIYKGDSRTSAFVYKNLGKCYYMLGDTVRGYENIYKALGIVQKLLPDNHPHLARYLTYMGDYFRHQQDLSKAFNYYKRALEINEAVFESDNPNIAIALSNLTWVELMNKNYRRAIQYANRGLSIVNKNRGNYIVVSNFNNQLGDAYRNLLIYDSAFICYNKVLAPFINGKNNKVDVNSLESSSMLKLQHINYALANIGSTLLMKGKAGSNVIELKLAMEYFEKADVLSNRLRNMFITFEEKKLFNDDMLSMYTQAVNACAVLFNLTGEKRYHELMFLFSERGKARLLSDVLTASLKENVHNIPTEIFELEKKLNYQIRYLKSKVSEVENNSQQLRKFEDYKKELVKLNISYDSLIIIFQEDYQNYYAIKYQNKVIDIASVQIEIESNVALIEFIAGESQYYVFLITKGEFQVFEFPKAEIDKAIVAFRKPLGAGHNYSPEDQFLMFTKNGYSVHEQLLKQPLKKLSDEVDELIVIPAGKLSYIPLELLPQSSEGFDSFDYKNIDYLMNNYIISYGYSATMKFTENATSHNSNRNQGKFIGYAPSYPNSSNTTTPSLVALGKFRDAVTPLEWNTKEVENISSQLHGDYSISEDATEGYFKSTANDYGIIHLAMHALIDDEDPLNSKLVFANSERDSLEDGFLHVYELFNMQLSSQMVVLSACNTGYGKLAKGEGLMSLGYGFAYAGCPSMVVSGWQVDDQSTSELMQLFYSHLKNGEKKNVALRNAKLEFLKNASPAEANPFYWGSFVLIGDIEPIDFDDNTNYLWLVFGLSVIGLIAVYLIIKNKRKTIV